MVVGLVNTDVHMARRGQDEGAFETHEHGFFHLGRNQNSLCICTHHCWLTGIRSVCKVLQAEPECTGRAAILLAAVTTEGAIYSSPINKAPTDSDTQADRGIIFI